MVKVTKKFMDKKTKKVYRPGDEYEGAKNRIEELASLGYVETEEVKESDKK